jgi:hypothetical protein
MEMLLTLVRANLVRWYQILVVNSYLGLQNTSDKHGNEVTCNQDSDSHGISLCRWQCEMIDKAQSNCLSPDLLEHPSYSLSSDNYC